MSDKKKEKKEEVVEKKFEIPENEYRFAGGEMEIREGKKGLGILGSIPFDSKSVDMGWVETIRSSAFDKTLKDGHDIVSAWNHDPLWVLGRRSNETLKFSIGEKALEYDVTLDEDDVIHRHFARRIERRDVTGSSFTFTTVRDEWTELDTDEPKRELVEIKMHEIGPVTFPAYPKSGAQARALCDVASIRIGEGLDLTELAQAMCRSQSGKIVSEDVELMHRWLDCLVGYLPREDVVSMAEMKVRKRRLRQQLARHGLN